MRTLREKRGWGGCALARMVREGGRNEVRSLSRRDRGGSRRACLLHPGLARTGLVAVGRGVARFCSGCCGKSLEVHKQKKDVGWPLQVLGGEGRAGPGHRPGTS